MSGHAREVDVSASLTNIFRDEFISSPSTTFILLKKCLTSIYAKEAVFLYFFFSDFLLSV